MNWRNPITTNTHTIYIASVRGAEHQLIINNGRCGYNLSLDIGKMSDNGEIMGEIRINEISTARLFGVEKEWKALGELRIEYKVMMDELIFLLRIKKKECW